MLLITRNDLKVDHCYQSIVGNLFTSRKVINNSENCYSSFSRSARNFSEHHELIRETKDLEEKKKVLLTNAGRKRHPSNANESNLLSTLKLEIFLITPTTIHLTICKKKGPIVRFDNPQLLHEIH